MDQRLSIRFLLLFYLLPFGLTTKFLPMVVWDHLNPQLSCSCNWLVVPRTAYYDYLEFVCPTLKIAVRQLDGYSRPEGEMNENIFRRKWQGSEEDFKRNVQNGSIHSFCNPRSPESIRMHSCRDGTYDSLAVTFKRNRDDNTKHYDKNAIYVFYNNEDDGKESTLDSNKVRCSILFAVYVSDEESDHDMTFGKKALTDKCQCNRKVKPSCPVTTTTTTTTTLQKTSTRTPLLTSLETSTNSTNVVQPTASPSPVLSTNSLSTTEYVISSKYLPTTNPSEIEKDVPNKDVPGHWLPPAVFVVVIIITFLFGIVCTLLFIALRNMTMIKKGPEIKDNSQGLLRTAQTA